MSTTRRFTRYHPEAPEKNDVVRPSSKGKRLVLLHAVTQDGWLTGYFWTGWRNAFLISPIREAVAQYRIHRNGSLSMPLSLCILSSLAVHPVLSLLIASVS